MKVGYKGSSLHGDVSMMLWVLSELAHTIHVGDLGPSL